MEQLMKEHERLERKGNLRSGIDDIQKVLQQLHEARRVIEADPAAAAMAMAKLQSPVKQSFDRLNDGLKEIHSGLGKYSKAMDKQFKEKPLVFAESEMLSSQTPLINRAIAMHLLREGHFDVASTFISEANAHPGANGASKKPVEPTFSVYPGGSAAQSHTYYEHQESRASNEAWDADFAPTAYRSAALQAQFSEMYHILHQLRNEHNLSPAIEWARKHSSVLEARGSSLEYDLCRLQYISLFLSPALGSGPLGAIRYARDTFPRFPARYASQTYALLGALAFADGIERSPYRALFSPGLVDDAGRSAAYAAAAAAFTSDFCALLSLSSASPLLTAVTAGCIALPTLLKLSQIQALHRTSWTTASELPVEIPLPPAFRFHSVFVCPVSKEQGTDANPPMMMPCGHVVAKESLERLSRGTRFKCPYCPAESHPRDAKLVFL